MNWDQIEGKWKQLKGSAKQHFGKLTDDDLEQIRGKRDMLVGKLQERYGIAKEQAQEEADQWLTTAGNTEGARSEQAAAPRPNQSQGSSHGSQQQTGSQRHG